jgi:hypothetical protein
VCGGCGSRIGVAQPAWVGRRDGTYRFASFLGIRGWLRRDKRFWHAGCLAGDYPPNWRRRPGPINAPRRER